MNELPGLVEAAQYMTDTRDKALAAVENKLFLDVRIQEPSATR